MDNTKEIERRAELMKKASKYKIKYMPDIDTDHLEQAVLLHESAIKEEKDEKKKAPAETPVRDDNALAAALNKLADAMASQKSNNTDVAAIAAAVASAVGNQNRKDIRDDDLMDEADIDPDDKVPMKCYFTWGSFWIMSNKRVGGQKAALPYKLKQLVFTRHESVVVNTGKQQNIKTTCMYRTDSLKIQTWIETSPEFADKKLKRIFLDPGGAVQMSDRGYEYQTYANTLSSLGTRHHNELMQLAGNYPGLEGKVTSTIKTEKLREMVAAEMTDEIIRRGKALAATHATQMEKLLTGAAV